MYWSPLRYRFDKQLPHLPCLQKIFFWHCASFSPEPLKNMISYYQQVSTYWEIRFPKGNNAILANHFIVCMHVRAWRRLLSSAHVSPSWSTKRTHSNATNLKYSLTVLPLFLDNPLVFLATTHHCGKNRWCSLRRELCNRKNIYINCWTSIFEYKGM